MQQELVELQPKLIQTSQETEELIGIIERETIDVEDIKRIVEVDEAVANKAAREAEAIKVMIFVYWGMILALTRSYFLCREIVVEELVTNSTPLMIVVMAVA